MARYAPDTDFAIIKKHFADNGVKLIYMTVTPAGSISAKNAKYVRFHRFENTDKGNAKLDRKIAKRRAKMARIAAACPVQGITITNRGFGDRSRKGIHSYMSYYAAGIMLKLKDRVL